MTRGRFAVIVVIVLMAILAFASTYSVGEYEQVIVTRFGEIVTSTGTPGLHLKTPFVDEVKRLDKRWLAWDGEPNEIPTGEKRFIKIDTYARWRISDPILFFQRLRDERSAQSRLDDIIDGAMRTAVANHALIEAVRSTSRPFQRDEMERLAVDEEPSQEEFRIKLGRSGILDLVRREVSGVVPQYGVEIADIQIKRINYEESVQEKVFERMISERKRIAARFRSEGEGRAAEIRGRIEKERKEIESEAYRRAEEIKGKADAAEISIATLEDHRTLQLVVGELLDRCRAAMDEAVIMQHAAAESAVAAYFEYAHVLIVSHRLQAIGEEMAAIVQLMTGDDPDSESGRRFSFPE
jgi:membrane protease subunit HflC